MNPKLTVFIARDPERHQPPAFLLRAWVGVVRLRQKSQKKAAGVGIELDYNRPGVFDFGVYKASW